MAVTLLYDGTEALGSGQAIGNSSSLIEEGVIMCRNLIYSVDGEGTHLGL